MDYFDQMLAQVQTWVLSHNQDGDQNGCQMAGKSNSYYEIWKKSDDK